MYHGIVTDCRQLNVRKEPNEYAEVVAVVDVFDKIFVDFENSEGDYYKVETTSGVEGYCPKANVCRLKNEKGECVASWNSIPDAPFGEEEGYIEVIPETSVTFTKGGSGESKNNFASYSLYYGKYTVVFDGKEYPDLEFVYQGVNMLPSNGLTEECPFQFLYGTSQFYALEPGTHTIAVYQKGKVVTPIPEKYIPAGVGGGVGVTWMELSGTTLDVEKIVVGDEVRPMTFSEFQEAYSCGIIRLRTVANGDAYYFGSIIGYHINEGDVNAIVCNGNVADIAMRKMRFAEE